MRDNFFVKRLQWEGVIGKKEAEDLVDQFETCILVADSKPEILSYL